MGAAAIALLVLGLLALVWPRVIAVPVGVIAIWLAASLLLRARTLHRERTRARSERRVSGRVSRSRWRRTGRSG
jgi:cardiolipin synthase